MVGHVWVQSVYPRVCGGTNASIYPPGYPRGLSPRVRGNRVHSEVPRRVPRSIPACAGEPAAELPGARVVKVYPRVCGGTLHLVPIPTGRTGLSPRVRGNRRRIAGREMAGGSIPACAGEPVPRLTQAMQRKVYPRVCGGTPLPTSGTSGGWGLSPRVRGNPLVPCPRPAAGGSIPACAGEPRIGAIGRRRGEVYPRVCGGTARS